MIFSFQKFIEDLRKDEDKKKIIIKYEKYFGEIVGEIKDQFWYKDYISKPNTCNYAVPEVLINDFDWDLLCQFVACSFSSEGYILIQNNNVEFLIDVKSGGQRAKKLVSELWGFQILRLFEIYCEEQLNLAFLIAEDDEKFGNNENAKPEKIAILQQRNDCLKKWEKELTSMPIKKQIHAIENRILALLD